MAVQQQKNTVSGNDAKDTLKYSPAPDAKPPQNKSQALIAEFQERLQHTLDAFKQKAAKQIADELPKAAEGIIKRSSKEFQKLAGDAGEKLREDLKTAGVGIATETQKQFADLAQGALNSFKVEAKSTAGTVLERMAASFQEQVQTASQSAGAALRSVQAAAEESRSTLNAAAEQAGTSLVREHQKQVADLSASGLKDLERKANRYLETFEGLLENALSAFKRAATERLEAELSKTTANLVEHSAAGLQKQVENETERLLERLRSSGTGVVEDVRRQLTAIEEASTESVNQSAKVAAGEAASQAAKEADERIQALMSANAETVIVRVEAAGNKLDAQADHSAQDFQKRLAELSVQTLESSWHKLDAQHGAFSEQLQNSVMAIEEKALEQARHDFSAFASELVEKGSGELRQQTTVAAERVKDEVKSSVSSLTEEARKQLLAEAQWSLHSLKEATAEQCQAQLNQIGKDFANDSRKKLSAELEDSIRKYRKLAQSQLENLSRASAAGMTSTETAGQAFMPAVPGVARSSFAGKVVLVFAAIAPTLLFLYFVSRPVMRLRPDPPAEFLTVSTEWGASHNAAQDKLARAYWDWAALHLVQTYPYGANLPDLPPLDFDVEGKDFPTGVNLDLTRLSYWNELRKLWTQPQSWTTIEVWNRQ